MEHFEQLKGHIEQRAGLIRAKQELQLRFISGSVDNFNECFGSDGITLDEIASLIGRYRMNECIKIFESMLRAKIAESLDNNEQNLSEFKIVKTEK